MIEIVIDETCILCGGVTMFRWKEYDGNSALFIDGINTNIAIIYTVITDSPLALLLINLGLIFLNNFSICLHGM